MAELELYLSTDDERITADRLVFQFNPKAPQIISRRGGSNLYTTTTENTFTWSVAVKALSVLILRMAASHVPYELTGEADTPAQFPRLCDYQRACVVA